MKILIGRHEEGITLNPLEYLLDGPKPDGKVLEFATVEDAKNFLRSEGITDELDLTECFVYYDADADEIL